MNLNLIDHLRSRKGFFTAVFADSSKESLTSLVGFIVSNDCEYVFADKTGAAGIYAAATNEPTDSPLIVDFRKSEDDDLLEHVSNSFYNRKFKITIGEHPEERDFFIKIPDRTVFFILNSIDECPQRILKLFTHMIVNDQLEEIKEEAIEMDDTPPPVYPLFQHAQAENGAIISRRVGPLTRTLMLLVKRHLDMPDTVDISDDEMVSEWSSGIGESNFPIFINCLEGPELYTLDVYFGKVIEEKILESLVLINDLNCNIDIGHFQFINNGIRYHNSVDVGDIAPKDPDYQGDHILPPRIIVNMFECAKHIVEVAAPLLEPCIE
jgi:hypothetical protein